MRDDQYPVESFSLAERDRRWAIVRSLMESAGIDILVTTDESSSRYLTQMADDIGPTIFPIDGAVTALTNRGRVGSAALTWIEDLRSWNRRWAAGIVERLQELNAARKIVGITGLDGAIRHPDGDLNYNTFVVLREVFSHARWVGAGELMQEARYRKSDEEIAFLERATLATEAGLRALADCLRPGALDRELWGEMILGMVKAGGEPPRLANLGMAPARDLRRLPTQPVGHLAAVGDILLNEIDGRFAGYEAQGVQPMALGQLPSPWTEAWRVHVEAWDRTWEILRPGTTFAQIESAVLPAATRTIGARQTLHGRGLGEDIPLIVAGSTAANRMAERVLEPGVCFVLKPYASWTGASGTSDLNWGDTVVITSNGARRLGQRPHAFIVKD